MKNNKNKDSLLKLRNDFFYRKEIRLIESMPNGKEYIVFYLKLLLISIENNGKLYVRNTIPYTPEMLVSVTSTSMNIVKGVKIEDVIDSETKWAEYKRKQKAKKKIIATLEKRNQ